MSRRKNVDLQTVMEENMALFAHGGEFNNLLHCRSVKTSYQELKAKFDEMKRNGQIKPVADGITRRIGVFNMDSFECAKKMLVDYQRFGEMPDVPVVLNMASDKHVGGGVRWGAVAQEEDLFRKSNYCHSLPFSLQNKWYPWSTYECIWTPTVTVMRDNSLNILPRDKHFVVACSAVAALRNPQRTRDEYDYFHERDADIMRDKIRCYFLMGLVNGHTDFVAGALGCGAFCNPNSRVSKLFFEVMHEYQPYWRHIYFAVLDFNPNPYSNYTVFQHTIAPNYEG